MNWWTRVALRWLVVAGTGGLWALGVSAQRSEAVAGRYVANGAEVTDTLTGLIWRRCSEGQGWTGSTCSGTAASFIWQGALDRARAAAAGGTAWRLPNVKELGTLADASRVSPAIDTTLFPATPKIEFWTSTAATYSRTWCVDFDLGATINCFSRYEYYAVRLVRSGQ